MKATGAMIVMALAMLVAMVQGMSMDAQALIGEDAMGKCGYKCPPHSKRKDKVVCCNSIYDCECDSGYKRVAHKGKCVVKPPKPTSPPVKPPKCELGIKRKNCCEGDECYEKKFGATALEIMQGEPDIEDSDPEIDDDEDEIVVETSEIIPYDELTPDDDDSAEEMEMEETGSLRASVLSQLEEAVYGGCGKGYVCAKGTKPIKKVDCPEDQHDCKCKCKGGHFSFSQGKCLDCPPKPPTEPPTTPKPDCDSKKCWGNYVKPYYDSNEGKCGCKCKKGYAMRDGECKPKKCFVQTSCK